MNLRRVCGASVGRTLRLKEEHRAWLLHSLTSRWTWHQERGLGYEFWYLSRGDAHGIILTTSG